MPEKVYSICSIILFCSLISTADIRAQYANPELITYTSLINALEHAQNKLRDTLEELSYNSELHPAHTNRHTGEWDREYLSRNEWTSGFFSGSLWHMYKLTGEQFWRDTAVLWTEDLESASGIHYDHDAGFRIFTSHGNAFKITEGRYYYRTTLNAAGSLSRRFNPEIGAIKSWDWTGNFPVIIDNLMNLEILFWVAEKSGHPKLADIARRHADTTLEHHMRPNGTFYHIVDFDNAGNVNSKFTLQGHSSTSVWARGQAWAIYGFTMIYRFTREERFLEAAMAASKYFIENLPDDSVPYYDFMEPVPSVRTKDASAAAIAASGLFELFTFTDNSLYFNTAVKMLESLSDEEYLTTDSNKNSILKNSTRHKGQGNVGTSYADYYYLEAIIRYLELNQNTFPEISSQPVLYLDQNYPNPFNNTTSIHYSIEEDAWVELSIYDITGRKIETVVNSRMPQGNHQTVINAAGLSSGTYFYVLRTNGTALTKKMILLK